MDDKIRDFAISAYKQAHDSEDPVISRVLEKLKNTPMQMAQKAQSGLTGLGQQAQNFGSDVIENVGSILGLKGPITQAFGNYNPAIEKYSGGVNYGTDIGVPTGTKAALPQGRWQIIKATSDGGMNQGYGNSVYAQNLETGEKMRLSHLSDVRVKQGQIIDGGQVIGLTGATGNAHGAHLDLEYYDQAGKLADVMKSRYAGGI